MNRLQQWWSDLNVAECPHCGEAVPTFARSCAACGARNDARLGAVAVASALVALLVAIIFAGVVVLKWQQLPVGPGQQQAEPGTPAADTFAWLSAAMKECDEQAAKEPATLHFLAIPLASKREDDGSWRAIALNDVGSAILLTSDAALDGLRRGSLRISPQEYIFSVRDEASGAVYKWNRSTGVAQFSTADADSVETLKIQFQTRSATRDGEWGSVFVRQKGSCYWVNAIIGN
jgi:hypothetical protein